MHSRIITILFLMVLCSFLIMLPPHAMVKGQPSEAYISVPYHRQIKNYYCGPAALQMVFDYYGPEISQWEIADVARTSREMEGTFTFDMVRAAHFSNLSTSVGNEQFQNFTGYTARRLGYAAFELWERMSIEDIKGVIAAGYPIIILVPGHFRVAVGYSSTHLTFQDSLFGSMINLTYEEAISVWEWSLFASPWEVEIHTPRNVLPGTVFDVTATITYPCPPPFSQDEYSASNATATITLSPGLSLVSGEEAEKTIGTGNFAARSTANITWTVEANSVGNYIIYVQAGGEINGWVPPIGVYPEQYYKDIIGNTAQSVMAVTSVLDVTPPTTIDDYDGIWRNGDFTINLAANDDSSGILETYYRINSGAVKTLNENGQPYIISEGTNSSLEYWSVDWAGNEEFPHEVLTGIKMDKRPPIGGVLINMNATYTNRTSVTLTLSANDTVSGVAKMRFYSNENSVWTPWETYKTSKTWNFESTNGIKTVCAQFMDNSGLISDLYIDSIILDTTVPTIGAPVQTPKDFLVQPDQEVKISANVVDSLSNVESVILSYNLNDGAALIDIPMVFNSTTNSYEAMIPGQPAATFVRYRVSAYDGAGNLGVEDNAGAYYTYTVVPEFSDSLFTLIFLVATILTMVVCSKRHLP